MQKSDEKCLQENTLQTTPDDMHQKYEEINLKWEMRFLGLIKNTILSENLCN